MIKINDIFVPKTLKFVLVSDNILFYNDLDFHRISGEQLRKCYNLPASACIHVNQSEQDFLIKSGVEPNFIFLRPRFDGDYITHIKEQIHLWQKMYG